MWSNNETVSQKKRSFIEEARRAPIVPAAIDTLAEVGYGQASLAKIAARAGVSKGVISYHFAGKADLMEHLVIEVYTRGAHFMIPRIQAEPNAPGMLRAAIKSNLAFIATNRAAIAAVMEVMANLRAPDGALRFDLATDEPNVYEVEWILQKGQEEGDFRAFDTRVMALAIRAAIDRSAALFRAEPNTDLRAYAEEMWSVFDHATRRLDTPAAALSQEG